MRIRFEVETDALGNPIVRAISEPPVQTKTAAERPLTIAALREALGNHDDVDTLRLDNEGGFQVSESGAAAGSVDKKTQRRPKKRGR